MVEFGNVHWIGMCMDREDAKRMAHKWIGGDKERYTVSPLTEPGDRLHVEFSLNV